MKYIPKSMIIFMCIVYPLIVAISVLEDNGYFIFSLKGFAVDSCGELYVGIEDSLLVLKEEEVIKRVSVPTSREYTFTIDKNDTIILDAAGIVYTMDINGKILSTKEDRTLETYNNLEKGRSEFTDKNGTKYKMVNKWGYFKIIKINENNEDVIYKMNSISYIAKIIDFAIYTSFVIIGPYFIYKWRKNAGISLIQSRKLL